MKIGYVRVSKQEQNEELQRDALKEAGCKKWFMDKMTGSKAERKGLDEALAYVRPGDTFVVWKLDRAGRSLTHLIELLKGLQGRDIEFMSLTEQIDTSTPSGKLVFHLMGALAEFERDLICKSFCFVGENPRIRWAIAQAFKLPGTRASMLERLAPWLPKRLPDELLEQVLGMAQAFKTLGGRSTGILERLPESLQARALAKVLDTEEYEKRIAALNELVPRLPLELLKKALDSVQTINDEEERDYALSKIAPHMPFPEALALIRSLRDPYTRKEGLGELALSLPETMLEQALYIAQEWEEIEDELFEETGLLAKLLSRLPEHSLEGASMIIQGVQDDWLRDKALIQLAQIMPRTMMKQALSALRVIKDEETRVWALRALVPQLHKEQDKVRSDDLGARLSPDLLEQALGHFPPIDGIDPVYRREMAQSIDVILYDRDEHWDHIIKMEKLSPELAKFSRRELYPFWNELLFRLSQRTRSHFLSYLGALAPVLSTLGGPDAVAKVVVAIHAVRRWWP